MASQLVQLFAFILKCSLVPRPNEKDEKGPGFSRSQMHLIVVEFHCLHILLMYFSMLMTPNIDTN